VRLRCCLFLIRKYWGLKKMDGAGADYGVGICRLIRWLRGLTGMRLIMGG
jgi:hypothetical protein